MLLTIKNSSPTLLCADINSRPKYSELQFLIWFASFGRHTAMNRLHTACKPKFLRKFPIVIHFPKKAHLSRKRICGSLENFKSVPSAHRTFFLSQISVSKPRKLLSSSSLAENLVVIGSNHVSRLKIWKKCSQDHFNTYVRDYQFKKAPPEAKLPESVAERTMKEPCFVYILQEHPSNGRRSHPFWCLRAATTPLCFAVSVCVRTLCLLVVIDSLNTKKLEMFVVSASFMAGMCKRTFSSLFST